MGRRHDKKAWLSVLMGGCCLLMPALAMAEDAGSRITDVQVNEAGDVVLSVDGPGFDPLLQVQAAPDNGKTYRVVIRGSDVRLDSTVQTHMNAFNRMLSQRIPAIRQVHFRQQQATEPGKPSVELVLESWQRLLPQIRSNSGAQIVITLVGNHQLPPGVQREFTPQTPTAQEQPPSVELTNRPAQPLSAPAIRLSSPPPEMQASRIQPDSGTTTVYRNPQSRPISPAWQQFWSQLTGEKPSPAEAALQQYLGEFPQNVQARYLRAVSLLQDRVASQEGRRQLQSLASEKSFLPACRLLIHLALVDGRLSEAQELLDKAALAFPEAVDVQLLQGRWHEASGDLEAARQSYLSVLSEQPDNLEALYRLAQVELKAGHLEAARWALSQAAVLSPENPRLLKLLGYIAERQEDDREAVQWYESALQPDALLNYGRLLALQGDIPKALTIFKAVETLAEDDSGLLYNLGMIYSELKQDKLAKNALSRFLDTSDNAADPQTEQAKSMLKTLDAPQKKSKGWFR